MNGKPLEAIEMLSNLYPTDRLIQKTCEFAKVILLMTESEDLDKLDDTNEEQIRAHTLALACVFLVDIMAAKDGLIVANKVLTILKDILMSLTFEKGADDE